MADTAPNEKPDYKSVLASVDKEGRRRWVEARIVWGRWRRWRAALAIPLIAFYCAIPFVSIGGKPAFQLDIAARKFYLAGIVFWPQDLTYFVILALLGIVGTLLTVALLGRVFCGWFCPHNVFLEMVFRPVEHFILGGPGNPGKTPAWRAALMWSVFVLIAGGLANAGTAIFVGAHAFQGYVLLDWAAHPYATVFWGILFICILFNFGWFRDQTCTIVCPYGRFQTAMLDSHTLTVAYDATRGEPRGHRPVVRSSDRPDVPTTGRALGDCIDCGLCVRVCPTAIDIRNGNQLECIHCAACIDACDGIMDKVGSPRGLIRYASEEQLAGRKRLILRPRTILYAVVCTVLIGVLAYRLQGRTDLLIAPLRQTAVPVREADPEGRDCVRAALPLSLVNRSDRDLRVVIRLPDALDARVVMSPSLLLVPAGGRITATPIVFIPRDRFTVRHLDLALEARDEAGTVLGMAMTAVRNP